MILKRHIFVFIVFIIPILVKGQNQDFKLKGLSLEADYGYGFVMPHHKSIEYFVKDHIKTFDLKLTKSTYGNKYWNQLYRYPKYGIGFHRSNLGNDDVFGYANALYTFVKVPFIGSSNKTNLSWQISFGASYLTDFFDIENNPQNLAIGSNLNIFIDLSLQSTIILSKKLSLTNGIRFTHFSNGKIKSPNKGLNVISGSVGLAYHLKDKPERIQIELPQIESKNEYTIVYAAGIKTQSRYEPGYYFASSLMLDYKRNYSLKGRWVLGADIFFDGTNEQYSINTEKADIINSDLYQVGLHAGHDLVMGHLALVINIGGYIYAPVEVLAPFYSRIGLRYRIKEKFITNFTLKSHYAKASYFEWGIGYSFN
ncbi:MAG: acyloxyacyl hydrolase [Bacteroidales bacterium]|nr:acyloxyacyl hydrolase [Bacteroidales bacterium]